MLEQNLRDAKADLAEADEARWVEHHLPPTSLTAIATVVDVVSTHHPPPPHATTATTATTIAATTNATATTYMHFHQLESVRRQLGVRCGCRRGRPSAQTV